MTDASRFPAADEPRFWTEFAAQLRQKVELASTDGSVRLPDAVPPTLALTVDFQPGHRVGLDWTVRYDVGEERRDVPARQRRRAARSVRDLAAEQALVAGLELPDRDRRRPCWTASTRCSSSSTRCRRSPPGGWR